MSSPSATQTETALIRVLVADDSAAIRTLARYSLSAKRGFSLVAEAADGAEALTLFDTHQPDCVVLDIEMPGVGGFEALDELRRRSPSLPVVMLSGYLDAAVMKQAEARGAAGYVEKSHGLVKLAAKLREVMQQPSPGHPEPRTEVAAVRATTGAAPTTPPPTAPTTPAAPTPGPALTDPASSQLAADLRRLEYVVSHDFAEPARVISGFATLLETRYGDVLDESGRLFVQHLAGGAQRLQTMVDDLLVYSRAGRSPVKAEPVELSAVMREVAAELGLQIRARHAVVRIGSLPVVLGDAALLQLVLRHLVVNALTFNDSDVPDLRVAGRVEATSAVVTVSDNGIGVSPSHCDEVFQLFRRLNTREQYSGTGTGLALCRRLVELQGGTIRLDSTLGQGTTVTLTLPLVNTPGETP